MIEIIPSLLSADFAHLEDEIRRVERAGCHWIHLDVMDGHFVSNITFGPLIVDAVCRLTKLKLGVHLMIEQPERYLLQFCESGADSIFFHAETVKDPDAFLEEISDLGVLRGMALNPETPVSAVEPYLDRLDMVLVMTVHPGFGGQKLIPEAVAKVARFREIIDQHQLPVKIEVDGGIDIKTTPEVSRSGAHALVAGSAVFHSADSIQKIRDLRRLALWHEKRR